MSDEPSRIRYAPLLREPPPVQHVTPPPSPPTFSTLLGAVMTFPFPQLNLTAPAPTPFVPGPATVINFEQLGIAPAFSVPIHTGRVNLVGGDSTKKRRVAAQNSGVRKVGKREGFAFETALNKRILHLSNATLDKVWGNLKFAEQWTSAEWIVRTSCLSSPASFDCFHPPSTSPAFFHPCFLPFFFALTNHSRHLKSSTMS
jgi:hypothetical protein